MALKIRLRRMGRKKAPTYRIVVAESTMPRDGRFVANLGHYNPRTQPMTLVVDQEKVAYWIGQGATPTDTVRSLLRKVEAQPAAEETVVEKVTKGAKTSVRKAAAAAGQAAAAAAAAAAAVVDTVQDAVGGDEGGAAEEAPADDAAAEEPQAE